MSSQSFDVIQKVLSERHSCRAFLSCAIEREVLRTLFETAQQTASWCNTQPWKVVLLSGAATDGFRTALMDEAARCKHSSDIAFPRAYEAEYGERRRRSGRALYETAGIDVADRDASAKQATENFRLFGAPHVAIITTPRVLGVYGAVDCGAYVSSVLLIAESLGLAAIAQASLAAHSKFIRTYLEIADERQVLCGIAIGYEDRSHPINGFRTERANIVDVIDWRDK